MAWLIWTKGLTRKADLQVLRFNRKELITTRMRVVKELEIDDEIADKMSIKELENLYGALFIIEEEYQDD